MQRWKFVNAYKINISETRWKKAVNVTNIILQAVIKDNKRLGQSKVPMTKDYY